MLSRSRGRGACRRIPTESSHPQTGPGPRGPLSDNADYGSTGSTQFVVPPLMLSVANFADMPEAPHATSSPPVLPVTFPPFPKNVEDSSLSKTPPPALPVTVAPANLTVEFWRMMTPWSPLPETVHPNLTATFLTIKSFLPSMKERRAGNIITISSAAARRPHPRSPIAYAAAKAGIELMTQAVAAQAGPYRIRANCIAPETILTERNEQRIPDEQKAALIEAHPVKRLGTPDDVARAALFLASENADWITGVILDVNGGAVMLR